MSRGMVDHIKRPQGQWQTAPTDSDVPRTSPEFRQTVPGSVHMGTISPYESDDEGLSSEEEDGANDDIKDAVTAQEEYADETSARPTNLPGDTVENPTADTGSSQVDAVAAISGAPVNNPAVDASIAENSLKVARKEAKEGRESIKSAKSMSAPRLGADHMPPQYYDSHISDIASMVASFLCEIVSINDRIPVSSENLTRFHSRTPPAISIKDYLFRIIRFCTLDRAILVTILYFIDILSQTYSTFQLNSLTVHRFIITSVAVATKGLCDSFCTNSHYAKVGGISTVELNMLEVEFLTRVNYRIVPPVQRLQQYFDRLWERHGPSAPRISSLPNPAPGTIPGVGPQQATAGNDLGKRAHSSEPEATATYQRKERSRSVTVARGSRVDPADANTPLSSRSSSVGPEHRKNGFRAAVKGMTKLLHPTKKRREVDDDAGGPARIVPDSPKRHRP